MAGLIPIDSPGWSLEYGEPGHPLVVVLHDWYGRLPWVPRYADALAGAGFRVIVPDLYNGVATTDPLVAKQLRDGLDLAMCLSVIDEAILDGRRQGSERFGVVGFSVGAWLALLHAQGGGADAVVGYYGSLDTAEHSITPCPVLLHLAQIDDWPAGADPASLVSHLKDHGTPVTEYTYAGARHSFANESIEKAWDPAVAALSFGRTLDFLEEHLR